MKHDVNDQVTAWKCCHYENYCEEKALNL